MKRDEISKIVFFEFEQILIDKEETLLNEFNENTQLMGSNSLLDSIDLVSFIVALEQSIEDKFSIDITIADENAMNQIVSPFKNLGTLIDFIEKKII